MFCMKIVERSDGWLLVEISGEKEEKKRKQRQKRQLRIFSSLQRLQGDFKARTKGVRANQSEQVQRVQTQAIISGEEIMMR